MARKLKTYQTSTGFFEQAIAAPSMKAELEAWVPIAIYPLRCREGELAPSRHSCNRDEDACSPSSRSARSRVVQVWLTRRASRGPPQSGGHSGHASPVESRTSETAASAA
jgi:hypothetical protein